MFIIIVHTYFDKIKLFQPDSWIYLLVFIIRQYTRYFDQLDPLYFNLFCCPFKVPLILGCKIGKVLFFFSGIIPWDRSEHLLSLLQALLSKCLLYFLLKNPIFPIYIALFYVFNKGYAINFLCSAKILDINNLLSIIDQVVN